MMLSKQFFFVHINGMKRLMALAVSWGENVYKIQHVAASERPEGPRRAEHTAIIVTVLLPHACDLTLANKW